LGWIFLSGIGNMPTAYGQIHEAGDYRKTLQQKTPVSVAPFTISISPQRFSADSALLHEPGRLSGNIHPKPEY